MSAKLSVIFCNRLWVQWLRLCFVLSRFLFGKFEHMSNAVHKLLRSHRVSTFIGPLSQKSGLFTIVIGSRHA
jgi:hypothetical protein